MSNVLAFDTSKRKNKSAYYTHPTLGDTTGMTEGEIVCRVNMINSKIRQSKIDKQSKEEMKRIVRNNERH
jgi:hypothetical protein